MTSQPDTDSRSDYLETVSELCVLARSFAKEAADRRFDVVQKADRSPVTDFDKTLERALRSRIRDRHPDDAIVGEEYGASIGSSTSRRRWILDPLDGTRAFVTGSPLWGTLIGVLHDGIPWIGAVELPMLGDRIIAATDSLHSPSGSARPRVESLCVARLCTTTPDKFTARQSESYKALVRSVSVHRYGGDCFNYVALARGQCDLVVEAGLAPHDYLPIVPVIESAGGRITDWHGRDLTESSDGTVLAASGDALHFDALRLLA
ncbi:inositol monophosphatase family protein [Burkholderia sp. Bp9140]|uniref:inositol monophosphatase family protein n=1 Tax=Burkholderia sp. Bp9140 TaxID=2184572 RepID=UPI0021AB1AAD|nr:inositol monophosphatase family protein [Burkholderia sp. Bp9140]